MEQYYSQDDLVEMAQVLDMIVEELPLKAKEVVESIIKNLEANPNSEMLFKIQDQLEVVSNMGNIDSFSRNEIINVIAGLDGLVNS